MPIRAFVFLVCGLSAAACESPSPASPSQPTAELNLSGTWSGPASDSTGPGRMTWQLSQTGSSLAGTLTMTDTGTGKTGRGSVSGTLTGTAVHFQLGVAAGGFESPYDTCSTDVSGDAQATASSISGTYSGTNSCTGVITSGTLTLTKTP